MVFIADADRRAQVDALQFNALRRDGQPITGALELADGSGHNFVWRPHEPWMPGSGYHVDVEIDNEAIGPLDNGTEGPACPSDCLDGRAAGSSASAVPRPTAHAPASSERSWEPLRG